jgi:acetylornithine deacetylase/succinyl-diaminopimelate desuccinylase-like protein
LNWKASISELSQLCSQPSVAAKNWGLEDCAKLVEGMLKLRGFETQILPTDGAPVVFAERKGKQDKTLLFYNHYDVQPPEPLELWISPPFQPRLEDGKLFARGVSDDKGHLVSRLFAIDAWLSRFGELPCNIKFVIEGEEEVGSVHLPDFVKSNTQLLRL